jgi:hypothetical protein
MDIKHKTERGKGNEDGRRREEKEINKISRTIF